MVQESFVVRTAVECTYHADTQTMVNVISSSNDGVTPANVDKVNTASKQKPKNALRVTVYASSKASTSQSFKNASSELGALLAKANYVCVNGGGAHGCMGALNEACEANGGVIDCIIHERFVDGNITPAQVRSLIVCGGPNLQCRKNLLLHNVDALVTLPGGPGTWEELWEAVVTLSHQLDSEMTCQKLILINVDGYYDGFITQLKRAEKEGVLYCGWDELLDVVDTPAEAMTILNDLTPGNFGPVPNYLKQERNKKKQQYGSSFITDFFSFQSTQKTNFLSLSPYMLCALGGFLVARMFSATKKENDEE
eukprot:g358.t1